MKGLVIKRYNRGIYLRPKNVFFRREISETAIFRYINSLPVDEAWYYELAIRGLIGLKTGEFAPPMYSAPIKIGRPL